MRVASLVVLSAPYPFLAREGNPLSVPAIPQELPHAQCRPTPRPLAISCQLVSHKPRILIPLLATGGAEASDN